MSLRLRETIHVRLCGSNLSTKLAKVSSCLIDGCVDQHLVVNELCQILSPSCLQLLLVFELQCISNFLCTAVVHSVLLVVCTSADDEPV